MNNLRRTRVGNVVTNRELSEILKTVVQRSCAYGDIRLVGMVFLQKYKSNLVLFKI